MSQGDEFEFQREAITNPEREQGTEGRRSVANDWAGFCATIIVKLRDGASVGPVF